MRPWAPLLLAVVAGLLLLWLALLVAFAVAARGQDRLTVREVLRLLPDVLRLLRGLAGDPTLTRRLRLQLVLLLAYLVVPLDLVPDVLPVIGYADDVVVIAIALRAVVRAAGPAALERHWPGSRAGLAALHRLARLPPV